MVEETHGDTEFASCCRLSCDRYQGIIHDFVMLNALRETNAANTAIAQATAYLRDALHTSD